MSLRIMGRSIEVGWVVMGSVVVIGVLIVE